MENQKKNIPDASVKMTLAMAKVLAELVEQKARQMGLAVVIAVADSGANPVYVACMDDSYLASYDVAVGKAYTSVGLKMDTIDLKPLAQPGASLYGVQFTNGGKIVIFGGGVTLTYGDRILGGLGVSGGSEQQDTELAAYGREIFDCVAENVLRMAENQ